MRIVGAKHGGFIHYRDLGGLEGAELDELIARQVRVFAERGEPFEWKLHAHDRPADLAERLQAAGFVPEASAAFSADGRALVTGSPDGTARIWDPGVAPELRIAASPPGCCTALTTAPGGTLVVAGFRRAFISRVSLGDSLPARRPGHRGRERRRPRGDGRV